MKVTDAIAASERIEAARQNRENAQRAKLAEAKADLTVAQRDHLTEKARADTLQRRLNYFRGVLIEVHDRLVERCPEPEGDGAGMTAEQCDALASEIGEKLDRKDVLT